MSTNPDDHDPEKYPSDFTLEDLSKCCIEVYQLKKQMVYVLEELHQMREWRKAHELKHPV
jgi:hypothetical protein